MTDFECFLRKNGITKKFIANYLGVSPAFVTQLVQGKRSIPDDKIALIKADKHWDSTMLYSAILEEKAKVKHPNNPLPDKALKPIPLVNQLAVAGFGNSDFAITERDVKEYYVVPKFKYCHIDFMIEISGSSMYPKYNSGDVVACTIIRESRFIQWNRCHVIATKEQGILVKRLLPSEKPDCIKVVSDNEKYPPFDVPMSEITGVAVVAGVIRLE